MKTYPLIVTYRTHAGTTERHAVEIESPDFVSACRAAEAAVAQMAVCAVVLAVTYDGQDHTN
jgi:hypothetical protein